MNTSSRSVVVDALWGQLETSICRGGVRPPPRMSLALELCRSDVASTRTGLAELLERDPALARVVHRSVSCRPGSRVGGEQSLAAVLENCELVSLRDLVFENAVRRELLEFAAGCEEIVVQIRRHSIVAAYLSRAICARASLDTKYAFLAGLLHDIGLVALLSAVDCVEGLTEVPLRPLWPYLQELHEAAGNYLAEHWGIPEPIRDAIAHHHSPRDSSSGLTVAVALADQITECFAAIITGPFASTVVGFERDIASFGTLNVCKERLRLSDAVLQDIVREAKASLPRTLWTLDA